MDPERTDPEVARYAASDLLDVELGLAPARADIADPRVASQLVLNYAWRAAYAVPVSKREAAFFASSSAAAAAASLDAREFNAFATQTMRMPLTVAVQAREYAQRLRSDPAFLRAECVEKIVARHELDAPPAVAAAARRAATPEEALALLTAGDPRAYFARAAQRIAAAAADTVNPLTQHHVGAPPRPCEGCVGFHDALRSVVVRDYLFTNQARASTCVLVETGVLHAARPCVIDVLIDEASAASKMPITIMSSDEDFLRERRDFFFFANLIPNKPETRLYDCIPRVFAGFVLVAAGLLPQRAPLSSVAPRCFYYRLADAAAPEADRDDYQRLARLYVMVTDTIASCDAMQRVSGSIVYIAPQFVRKPPAPAQHTVAVGVHPDTLALLPAANPELRAVEPDDAGACAVYVNLLSDEGCLECMAAAGVPVVAREHDGMFDGFNCKVYTGEPRDLSPAVAPPAPDAAAIAERARRCAVVNDERVFRWVWGGILSGMCPVKANSPKHGALLNTRFLVMSALALLRRAQNYDLRDDADRNVLVIDNRRDPGTVLSAMVTLANLQPGWGLVAFCSADNEQFMREMLPRAATIKLMSNYPSRGFFIEQYNRLMKTEAFWRCVPGTKCLIVQNDGTLVRPGLEDSPCFRYSLVGAPWAQHPYLDAATGGNRVGNGGLSLRDPRECERVCREHHNERLNTYELCPVMSEAEDVFFARRFPRHLVCPRDLATNFSMEQVRADDPLGFHRFWVYHPTTTTVGFFENAIARALAGPR